MRIPTYQQQVAAFTQSYQLESTLEAKLLDLVSEVGEMSKEHLRSTQYGQHEFRPNTDWHLELGDVFYSLIAIANETGVDLSNALTDAMAKYLNQLQTKGDPGSGQ